MEEMNNQIILELFLKCSQDICRTNHLMIAIISQFIKIYQQAISSKIYPIFLKRYYLVFFYVQLQ